MKVTWKETREVLVDNPALMPSSFSFADDFAQAAPTKFVDIQMTGEVIDKCRSLLGTPKFIVALEDGTLRTVSMEDCKLVRDTDSMDVRCEKLSENAVIPQYAHATDAGLDLVAVSKGEDEYGNVVYGFGLAFEIPEGYAGFIFPRSSNHKHSLLLSNCVGIIDSGYRGEVTAKFRKDYQYYHDGLYHNQSGEYEVGEKVCQMVIMPYPKINLVESEELSNSDRGAQGYGSTGK